MKQWILSVVVGIGIFGMATDAHHSIAAHYDSNQQVTIEGVIMQLEFVNPHPFLTLEVTDSDTAQQWRLEMDNRWELVQVGFTTDTLRPGDRIVVVGDLVSQAHS